MEYAGQKEIPASSQGAASMARDCLLVVDDQIDNIKIMRAMLGRLGFEILPATTGAEALELLAKRRPDLILLDLMMPDMDGLEVCRRIQENPQWADIPVIFLSSTDDKNVISRALETGGVDYLSKPFHTPELLSRVRTHLMLKTTRDHLKQLAQEKEELLGMISHHLLNRLAGMEMSAQLLVDRTKPKDDPRIRLLAENLCGATKQMHSFIKALLANANADRGVTVRMEAVHFAEMAGRAVARYEEAAKGKDLVLRTDLPNNGIIIRADPNALDQVFDNLLSNALKFSPPGREVLVSLQRNGNHAECHIKDQGPGFTAEDTTRLYQRYARLSARPTGGEPSSGLGLSIANKLMHAMNGELTCISSPGNGATFVLRFAAAPSNG
jgi:two-component system sensor histidine kinase/response regulator